MPEIREIKSEVIRPFDVGLGHRRAVARVSFSNVQRSRHEPPREARRGSGQIAGDQRSCRDRGPDHCEQAQQHS